MTTKDVKRKLRAILSADVQGYSRLMGDDEVATVKTITEYRETLTSLVNQYTGRVVDSPGDNVLAEFGSVVDAVQCAVEIQNILKAKNEELPENRRMIFRIGVNLGDVIQEGERIYGDGVNIAARIESLADGGGICISGTAYDQIENKLALGYNFMGEHSVKNIAKPVRVYKVPMEPGERKEKRVRMKKWQWTALAGILVLILAAGAWTIWNFYFRPPPIEPASVEKMAYPLPDKLSIAVLPFVNLSGDPKQEYLSDGITEQIITGLSRVPKLFVIARNSTFAYKGKPVKVQKVAEELGVRYVLEGSVQKSADRIRITAQLVDATTGRHLWVEKYDRDLKDIFALQDEITMKIMIAMRVKLAEGERARLYARGTDNVEAYVKFLQGYEYFARVTEEDNVRAREFFQEAIALDPEYSTAYAWLGFTHMMDARYAWSKSRRESTDRALELAKKAIALGDPSARGAMLVSYIYRQKRQYDKSIAEIERVIELDPNSADAYAHLAGRLYAVGRGEEAVASAKKAMRLNPISPWFYFYWLGMGHWVMGQYEEAIEAYKKGLNLRPTNLVLHVVLTTSYSLLGRGEEARAEAAEVLRLNPKFSVDKYAKRLPFKDKALTERYVEACARQDCPTSRRCRYLTSPPLPCYPLQISAATQRKTT